MNLKTLAVAVLIVLAAFGVFIGAKATIEEVRTYQALKGEHIAILKYLGEPIASQKGEDGKDTPITRAMILDAMAQNALKQAAPPQ